MSQHIFKQDQGGEVWMGYDRPLDYVFCCIFDTAGETLYSNLADPAAGTHCKDVNYFRRVLAERGISVPEAMFTGVAEDQRHRAGNRRVNYNEGEK